MSHADTLRRFLTGGFSAFPFDGEMRDEALATLDALEAENQRLRQALAEILVEASSYHGGLNRKTNALNSIVVRARDALDSSSEAVLTRASQPRHGIASDSTLDRTT